MFHWGNGSGEDAILDDTYIAVQLSGTGQVVRHPVKVLRGPSEGPCRRTACHRIFFRICM